MLASFHTKGITEAGCDEAGRGCLAGPVVAAAVILPSNYRHSLLNDSKKLKKADRDLLRKDIEQDALAWAVAEVDHLEIDRINILNASFLAMHRAIEGLTLRPQCLLIDGNRFTPYPDIPHHCIIKGDGKYLSIAAASILAKTYRDELMCSMARLYPDYGWESNAGYPTTLHRRAIAAIGPTPYHRRSFRLLPEQLEIF
ncbi:ribonuclease HII [Roseivirga sp. BDSF3-8]|uniref:ribonuclease HII n=1 Tax=Roseivirga sp. BDSF3-8 TaxID=3241598 RepID=UPI0035322235